MKVGFFDSGVGGITLLSYARDNVAGEDYVFYADEDNVPYGIKTAGRYASLPTRLCHVLWTVGARRW